MLVIACLAPSPQAARAQGTGLLADDPFEVAHYGKLYTHRSANGERGVPPVKVGNAGAEAGLSSFEDWLQQMREARDGLRDTCLGPFGDKMIRSHKGRMVLVSPDWLNKCNRHAALLTMGHQGLDEALKKWNAIASTSYKPLRGPKADLDAWAKKKSGFLNFDGTACDVAMHDILIRAPLGQVSHKQVYAERKGRCGPEWDKLFEPSTNPPEAPSAPEQGQQATEKKAPASGRSAGNLEDLQSELDAIEAGGHRGAGASRPGSKQKDIAPEPPDVAWRDALKGSGGLKAGVTKGTASAVSKLEAEADEAAALAQATSVGAGENQPPSPGGSGLPREAPASQGCDEAEHRRRAADLSARETRRISTMALEVQQCEGARLQSRLTQAEIAFASRCAPAQVASLSQSLAASRNMEATLCGGASSTRGAQPGVGIARPSAPQNPAPRSPSSSQRPASGGSRCTQAPCAVK